VRDGHGATCVKETTSSTTLFLFIEAAPVHWKRRHQANRKAPQSFKKMGKNRKHSHKCSCGPELLRKRFGHRTRPSSPCPSTTPWFARTHLALPARDAMRDESAPAQLFSSTVRSSTVISPCLGRKKSESAWLGLAQLNQTQRRSGEARIRNSEATPASASSTAWKEKTTISTCQCPSFTTTNLSATQTPSPAVACADRCDVRDLGPLAQSPSLRRRSAWTCPCDSLLED
jgi:hypothetical protein